MGIQATLQRPTSVNGDSTVSQISMQAITQWLDVGDWADVIITLWVDYASTTGADTLDLEIYTCTDKDATAGSAKLLATFPGLTSGSVSKQKAILGQDAWPAERWIFWQLAASGTGGPFEASFRASAMLKRPA